MKKLLASILTVTLLGAGLLAFSGGSPASAAYPGEVKTQCEPKVPAQVPAGKTRAIRVKIAAAGSTPRGKVQILFRHNGKVVKIVERPYRPGFRAFTPRTKKTGRYNVVVRFLPRSVNSPYRYSQASDHYRVTR